MSPGFEGRSKSTVVAGRGGVRRRGMGGNVDQRSFKPLGIGITELERGQFLQVIVQQPGVIERGLQDQRLTQRWARDVELLREIAFGRQTLSGE